MESDVIQIFKVHQTPVDVLGWDIKKDTVEINCYLINKAINENNRKIKKLSIKPDEFGHYYAFVDPANYYILDKLKKLKEKTLKRKKPKKAIQTTGKTEIPRNYEGVRISLYVDTSIDSELSSQKRGLALRQIKREIAERVNGDMYQDDGGWIPFKIGKEPYQTGPVRVGMKMKVEKR